MRNSLATFFHGWEVILNRAWRNLIWWCELDSSESWRMEKEFCEHSNNPTIWGLTTVATRVSILCHMVSCDPSKVSRSFRRVYLPTILYIEARISSET
jgi:hypothetical protein